MKILAVADVPSEYLWGPDVREALSGMDLILGCGDLPAEYLEYLATFTTAPVLYVNGNHDSSYATNPPGGCTCIDGRLIKCKGLRILGLGGSILYNGESPFQYSQAQMRRRAWKLKPLIHWHKGFDILVAHSGAFGLGDDDDRAHVGFAVFNELIEKWQPYFFIHGHSHLNYSRKQKRLSYCNKTQVINAYERYVFDVIEP